ncbi:hypothetical protein [Limnoglobus roseus]|uniref:Uncharacterized protein n=1 Tax=Limnoglobus roseus TaxID=2598579 RepID=A0A5C1AHF2_9BACT|nr:hypothetical protein [Limnoglobus roseus]QEL17426.1 hypothetical protein PX52LOC_04415 [Limnoglobus roseus]
MKAITTPVPPATFDEVASRLDVLLTVTEDLLTVIEHMDRRHPWETTDDDISGPPAPKK